MIRLDGLTKRYGDLNAVDGVNLRLGQGQMIGVIGRSGAGKSTLLRLINRLVEPSEGRILFEGANVAALKGRALHEWRARCAMIFQHFNLVGRLDVLTNVLIGRLSYHATLPTLFKHFSEAERALALRALQRLDVADKALVRADTLSGGQQQRVAIARALVQQPRIVLADEPIASLDPRNATLVMDALRAISHDDGITVICNLHTLDTARSYCDRIIGMSHGRVVFDGAPAVLTGQRVREIYGVDSDAEELQEAITSTGARRRFAAPDAVALRA